MISLKNLSREYQREAPTVILMVNDKAACNMNCTCCYLPYEGVRDPDQVVRIIENLRSRYTVLIAGSELLTDLRYLKAYQKAGQKYVLTNGILLSQNPQLYDLLKEYGIEEIQLSLNFKGQKQESFSSGVVPKVVREAKDRGFYVRIACIINSDNFECVEEICDVISDMGADAVFFIRYIKSGSAVNEDKEVLSQQQKEVFFSLVDQARQKYPKDKFSIQLNGNFGPKQGSVGETMSRQNEYCTAGRKRFVIAPDDKIYGCTFLMGSSKIGELIDESRLKITADLCDGDRSCCITDFLCK